MTDKEFKDHLDKYGAKELATNLVFPTNLTEKEKQEADNILAEALRKNRVQITDAERLEGNLLQLRFQMENALGATAEEVSVGDFIKRYLKAIGKSQTELAKEITLAPAIMSQYINNRRLPSESIMVRFEIHSGQIIPAEFWLRLIVKEKASQLRKNKALRRKEKQYVKKEAL